MKTFIILYLIFSILYSNFNPFSWNLNGQIFYIIATFTIIWVSMCIKESVKN